MTTETCELTNLVAMNKPLVIITKKFMDIIKYFSQKRFTNIKIRDKPNKDLDSLYNKRKILRFKTDDIIKIKLEQVDIELSNKYS